MIKAVRREHAEELHDLFEEVQRSAGRAAAALRLSRNWDAPEDEMLSRFYREEARVRALWQRIAELRSYEMTAAAPQSELERH